MSYDFLWFSYDFPIFPMIFPIDPPTQELHQGWSIILQNELGYGNTNADAGVGIGMLRGDSKI